MTTARTAVATAGAATAAAVMAGTAVEWVPPMLFLKVLLALRYTHVEACSGQGGQGCARETALDSTSDEMAGVSGRAVAVTATTATAAGMNACLIVPAFSGFRFQVSGLGSFVSSPVR